MELLTSYNTQIRSENKSKKKLLLILAVALVLLSGSVLYYQNFVNDEHEDYEIISLTSSEIIGHHVYDIIEADSYGDLTQVSTDKITQNELGTIRAEIDASGTINSYTVSDVGYTATEKRFVSEITLYYDNSTYRVVTLSLTADTETMLIDGIAVSEAAEVPEVTEESTE